VIVEDDRASVWPPRPRRRAREHAIKLLDTFTGTDVHAVDAVWTSARDSAADGDNGKGG
jgi:hypothetical protein